MIDEQLEYLRRKHAGVIRDKPSGKSSAGYWAEVQDRKAMEEHSYELNKRNVCPSCHMLRTKSGKCSMGCDE
jgi:hypothetical protein